MGTSKFPGTAQFIRQKAKTESIAFSDGRVYYTQTVDTRTEICCFDISASDSERLCVLSGLWQIKNFDIAGNNAYILGSDDSRSGVQGEYSDQFGTYSYNGEMLYRINLKTGETAASAVEFPQAFCADRQGVTVYAADVDGYYFTDFDGSRKQYNDLGNLRQHRTKIIYWILHVSCLHLSSLAQKIT